MDIVNVLKALGNSTAFGHDGIDSMSIKMAATSLYLPLKFIVNLSIRKSVFANKWRIGRIIPLHKGNGLDDMERSSFRHISLLSVTSKGCRESGSAANAQFPGDHRPTKPAQQRVQKAYHSTTSAIIEMTDAIFEATDRNLIATIATVDESCAFECVVHDVLIREVEDLQFWSQRR